MLADAIVASRSPARLSESAIYTHLVMVAGLLATAVGYELVISHPLGHTDPAWIAVVIGGPAVFIAGRSRFEFEVFGRVSRHRLIGMAVLVALAPLMVLVPPVAVATVSTSLLAGIAGTDTLRARRRPPERPAPPI